MHTDCKAANAATELEAYFDTGSYAHAANLAALTGPVLVLESYGAGHAWLKPESIGDPEPEDALYWPTDAGRELCARWRARDALFSRDWPTVAEAGR